MITARNKHPHTKSRILVIDDEGDIRDTLDMFLSMEGYEVSTAENGARGLEQAQDKRFDVAITDLKMPGLSGPDTVAALKRAQPALSVIVVTGYVSEESATRCRAEGASQILQKPFPSR